MSAQSISHCLPLKSFLSQGCWVDLRLQSLSLDVLHWPVHPYCLSSAVRVLIISCRPRLITSYQTSRSVSCCAFLLSCIDILPHWPGILTWLWIWGTSCFGEPQISLLGTCCCPSTEFAVIFPSFLSSSPLPSIQRNLSPFVPPPFFWRGGLALFFKNIWPGMFDSPPATIMLGLQECITSLGSTHLFCQRHSVWERNTSVFWGFRFLGHQPWSLSA